MPIQLSDVFSARAVAINRTEVESNKIPYMLKTWFPEKKRMGIDINWIKTRKGLGVALKPSNFDAIPKLRGRGQFQITKEEMPFFRESMLIKERDMMEVMRATSINDPYLDTALLDIFDDTNNLVDGADIAVEKMRANLVCPVNGNVGITIGIEDNTVYNYDYDPNNDWKNTHYVALSGTSTWDNNSTAKPLDNLRAGITYLQSIGVMPKYILGNSTTLNYLVENDQMKNALLSLSTSPINFLNNSAVEDVLQRQLRVEYLAYDKMYTDYDGTDKKFYLDDYVTIIGAGTLGNTYYGTTPEERTLLGNSKADVAVLDRGVAIAVKTEQGPPVSVTTSVSQIVLPSFEGMDSIYVIKVK